MTDKMATAVPEDFYDNYNSPFILNVKKEGVAAYSI